MEEENNNLHKVPLYLLHNHKSNNKLKEYILNSYYTNKYSYIEIAYLFSTFMDQLMMKEIIEDIAIDLKNKNNSTECVCQFVCRWSELSANGFEVNMIDLFKNTSNEKWLIDILWEEYSLMSDMYIILTNALKASEHILRNIILNLNENHKKGLLMMYIISCPRIDIYNLRFDTKIVNSIIEITKLDIETLQPQPFLKNFRTYLNILRNENV